jgi:hypothetical protein
VKLGKKAKNANFFIGFREIRSIFAFRVETAPQNLESVNGFENTLGKL